MCGMQVDPETAAASRTRDGSTYYFCSNRCAERFDLERSTALPNPHDQAVDPVCGMRVARNRSARGRDSLTYYFCSPACESAFLRHEDSPSSAPPINLGTKPSHE
jgi:YHS domain-containing protein